MMIFKFIKLLLKQRVNLRFVPPLWVYFRIMKYYKDLLFLVIILLTGCKTGDVVDDGELKIVATTGMLGDVAKSLVGDKGEVVSLMGPGVDPHLYKATQGDLKLLKEADIIIYNGLHLEGKMGEVLEKLAKFPNKKVVAAADGNQLLTQSKMH